jgi:hypothetical protein
MADSKVTRPFALSQAWIDKVTAATADAELECIVTSTAQQEEHDKQVTWMLRYLARFVEAGCPLSWAISVFDGGRDSHDYESDPADAAQGDMDAILTE